QGHDHHHAEERGQGRGEGRQAPGDPGRRHRRRRGRGAQSARRETARSGRHLHGLEGRRRAARRIAGEITMASRTGDVKQAATALEAYFLRRVLAEVHTNENSLTNGGFAGDTFKEMFDEAIADKMSQAGGIGLAKVLARQLDPKAAVTKTPANKDKA